MRWLLLCLTASMATSSPSWSEAARPVAERQDNARVFDAVWDGIRRNFHDADAVDVAWRRARDRFRPLALDAPDESALYGVINAMLRTLGDGHTVAAPPSYLDWASGQGSGAPALGLGINLAPRADGWHVTEVTAGEPGEVAGLKIGAVVLELDGRPLTAFSSHGAIRA